MAGNIFENLRRGLASVLSAFSDRTNREEQHQQLLQDMHSATRSLHVRRSKIKGVPIGEILSENGIDFHLEKQVLHTNESTSTLEYLITLYILSNQRGRELLRSDIEGYTLSQYQVEDLFDTKGLCSIIEHFCENVISQPISVVQAKEIANECIKAINDKLIREEAVLVLENKLNRIVFGGRISPWLINEEIIDYYLQNKIDFANEDEISLESIITIFALSTMRGRMLFLMSGYIGKQKVNEFTIDELIGLSNLNDLVNSYMNEKVFDKTAFFEDVFNRARQAKITGILAPISTTLSDDHMSIFSDFEDESVESLADLLAERLSMEPSSSSVIHVSDDIPPAPPISLISTSQASSSSQSSSIPIPPPPPPPTATPVRKKFSELSAIEREKWLTDPDGLNIPALKFIPTYPSSDTFGLAEMGLLSEFSGAGKPISPDKPDHVELAKHYYHRQIHEYFNELMRMDPVLTEKVITVIDSKEQIWVKASDGVGEVYKYLKLQVESLRKQVIKQELESSSDPRYMESLSRTAALQERFNNVYEQFQQAMEPSKSLMVDELNGIISELQDCRSQIRNNVAVLSQSKAALEKMILTRVQQTNLLVKTVSELEENIKIFEQQLNPRVDPLGRNKTHLESLKHKLKENQSELAAFTHMSLEQTQELREAQDHYQRNLRKQLELEVIVDLFLPSATMSQFKRQSFASSRQASSSSMSSSSSQLDLTCMGDDPNNRQFDIQFFNIMELTRLSYFFETRQFEFNVTAKEGVYALMTCINAHLSKSMTTFRDIVNVASGRIERQEGCFSPFNPKLVFSENIKLNEHIVPDYDQYIKRSELHIATNRSITITPNAGKIVKFYEYSRTFNIDVLTDEHITNLAAFFATRAGDLCDKAGAPNKVSVGQRLNKLLNSTNISSRDIIDVATGYKKRCAGSFASMDDYEVMLTEDILTRVCSLPDYDSFEKVKKISIPAGLTSLR